MTRKDLYAGYQLVQTAHSVAEFAHQYPDQFNDWKQNSNYIISLSVDNEEKLQRLFYKLQDNGADVVAFTEPDINDQLTSICYYGTPEMRKLTDKLDLALEEVNVATNN
ncbi:MAG: hypothetical protein WC428_01580 [Candidatus Paceibacterota bacterium]